MEDDNLWTPRDLARFLGYSESTISRMVSEFPEKLPPRVSALARPRWVPEVVREWALAHSNIAKIRNGRRRNFR